MEDTTRPPIPLMAFMADLHHEIRSPLNTILNMTELAQREPLSTNAQNYLKQIERSANALLTLIDDMIDLSEDSTGGERPLSTFSITDVLEDIKEKIDVLRKIKGVEISLHVGEDVGDWLYGPCERFRQLLTQFLNFSIRQLKSKRIELFIGLDQVSGEEKLLTTRLTSHKNYGDIEKAFKNVRFIICKTLLSTLGHELFVKKDEKALSLIFGLPVRPVESQKYLALKRENATAYLIDSDHYSSEILKRRLYFCDFEVKDGLDLDKVFKDVSSIKVGQRRCLIINWHELFEKDMDIFDFVTGRNQEIPVLIYDIPPVKMMDIQKKAKDQNISLGDIGLVMAPSRGKQFVSELIKILNITEDDLPCKRLFEEGKSLKRYKEIIKDKKILVVEDDKINQRILLEILKGVGAKPVVASNGEAAIKAVNKIQFNAILMDINLPDTDGYRLTKKIRGLSNYKRCPVIALTASTKNQDLCKEAGMNEFLTKPYSEERLLKVLAESISKVS